MITFDRKQLATELALLQSVLEVKTTMPILAYVKIEAENGNAILTATNISATMIVSLPCDGEFTGCVELKPLTALIRLFSGDEVKMEHKGSRCEIRNGRSVHKLPLQETDQFPTVDEVQGESFSVNTSLLLAAIEHVLPCADRHEGRYNTQGVCVDASEGELNVIALDGIHMGVSRISDSNLSFKVLLPVPAADALTSILDDVEESTLTVGATVQVECGHRKLLARLATGEFPPWRMLIPKNHDHEVTTNEEIAAAIKRCSVSASAGSMVRKRLILDFKRDSLTVRNYETDNESSEDVTVGCPTLNGDTLSIKVNADQFLMALSNLPSAKLSFKDSTTAMMFTAEDRYYVQMPLRLDK